MPLRHCYYKPSCFPHIAYISKLVRNLKAGVEKVTKSTALERALQTDVVIRITYVGEVTEENLSLVTKRKGRIDSVIVQCIENFKTPLLRTIQPVANKLYQRTLGKERMSIRKEIWDAIPVVCFQNDKNNEETFKQMIFEEPCQKILVKSDTSVEETVDKDNSIIMVPKDQARKAIIACLEKPLCCLVEKWKKVLEATAQDNGKIWIITQLENICKHMLFGGTTLRSPSLGKERIVPRSITEYLFSQNDVTSFGVWQNSRFKVFVQKDTDKKKMQNELTKLNPGFFEKYSLEFDTRNFVAKTAMKQGDCIQGRKKGSIVEGTLGGFVKETCDDGRIYGLTCSHVFPEKDCFAFDNSLHLEIGQCVFTINERCIDFAAIEMNESANCDDTFRNEDGKKTQARTYEREIKDIGVVHKIGNQSGTTNGSILSSEFYNKFYDQENKDSLFLVGGDDGEAFSEPGDSGALVFSHPSRSENVADHNYVNVIGMVFGTYEKTDERSDDDQNCSSENGDNISLIYQRDVGTEPEYISTCCRICPALDLFQEDQRVSVKFKDDISSSSSSSSSSTSPQPS